MRLPDKDIRWCMNHAGIAHSGMWDEQLGDFAQHYRVLRHDMRDFGKSQVPPGPCSLRGELRELLRVRRTRARPTPNQH